jgi:hypothetical protein
MRAVSVALSAALALSFVLPLLGAGAQPASGVDFELDLDRSTFFELAGRNLTLGFVAYNFLAEGAAFTLECSGTGVIAPAALGVNISAGGNFAGNFSVSASGPGTYDLTVTMRHQNETARGLAEATFLPPLSARFVSPAANGRIGIAGVGQTYTGRVNFTNFGAAAVSPTFSLPSRDVKGIPAGSGTVTLQVGEVPAGGSRTFAYEGNSLGDVGTREIAPSVRAGGLDIMYGFEVLPDSVTNVTRLGFTLAARELLGVELSGDQFALGKASTVTLYVESRLSQGVAAASLDITARSDIRARYELSDYAAEPRFEEFAGLVESGVSFTRRYDLGPMAPGVQEELRFELTPRICRASSAGGSYFLDFKADLGGTGVSATRPISVISPLELTFDGPEKVSYRELGAPLTRTVTVRNISNSTISGASASFFLDYREKGFVRKADIAGTPATPLPSLAPGDSASVRLEVVPRSPGTYTFFPVIGWSGLSVYGSPVQVVASAGQGTPVGPYVTAALVILVPVALTRKLTPG